MRIEQITEASWGAIYSLSSKDESFDVDLRGERVAIAVSKKILKQDLDHVALSQSDAERIAENFAKAHFKDLDSDSVSLTRAELREHGIPARSMSLSGKMGVRLAL